MSCYHVVVNETLGEWCSHNVFSIVKEDFFVEKCLTFKTDLFRITLNFHCTWLFGYVIFKLLWHANGFSICKIKDS